MAEECEYYYYDHGYCCLLKRESTGNSSIDEDTVDRYCWGYHYDDCPRYKEKKNAGGCFLSSACVEAKGLPDDCYELTVLRNFRDSYLSSIEGGKAEIRAYYDTAPAIVDSIKKMPNSQNIFEKIYQELVLPCVNLIEEGKNQDAHNLYSSYTCLLKKQYL